MRAALCVSIGAAVNLLVAWSCALWPVSLGGSGLRMTECTRELPDARCAWPYAIASYDPPCRQMIRWDSYGATKKYWSCRGPVTRDSSVISYVATSPELSMEIEQYGWPFRSLETGHEARWNLSQRSRAYRTLFVTIPRSFRDALTRKQGFLIVEPRAGALPIVPVWPGFVFNTLLFAATVPFPVVAFFHLRRQRRITQSRCCQCAYDLRGLPLDARKCPECGRATAKASPR